MSVDVPLLTFKDSPRIELIHILDRREQRAANIQSFIEKYPTYTIMSVGMNIPGPYKNSPILKQVFLSEIALLELELKNQGFTILEHIDEADLMSGPESFYIIDANPLLLKKLATAFEDTDLHRLFDVDIHYLKDGELLTMKRVEVGKPARKCLICSEDAKVCASRRVHTVEEMQEKIDEIVRLTKGW